MANDYSTIEHDFLHMKDYFSNYKFTYKERKSKLDFLQNICNEPAHDMSVLMASSKEQLVAVKNVYKKTDLEIKELSTKIYEAQEKLAQNQQTLDLLCREEDELKQKLAKLTQLNESILEQEKIRREAEQIESESEKLLSEIERVTREIDHTAVENRKEEEKALKENRDDLAAKQRRLTIINTDNFIEDIYCWNSSYLEILEKIFGTITVNTAGDKFNLKVQKHENVLELAVKTRNLVECFLPKNQVFETTAEFEKLKAYCMQINDAKPLLTFFLLSS